VARDTGDGAAAAERRGIATAEGRDELEQRLGPRNMTEQRSMDVTES
jgi:hypothetical protein